MNFTPSVVAAQNKQQRHYNEVFRGGNPWDTPVQPILWDIRFSFARRFLRPHSVVFDLGCGEGTISRAAAPLVKSVFSVDISSEAVRVARQRGQGVENIAYSVCSVEDFLTGAPGPADVCMMFEVIEHLGDVGLVLDLLSRNLRSGGTLVLSTPNRNKLTTRVRRLLKQLGLEVRAHDREPGIHEYEFTPLELSRLLRSKGFTIESLRGAVLGPELLLGITSSPLLHALNAHLGRPFPALAAYTFIAARRL